MRNQAAGNRKPALPSGAIAGDDHDFGLGVSKCATYSPSLVFLLTAYTDIGYVVPIGYLMKSDADKADVLQGTLILLVLRTLEALGPLHGYGIARRIEQISKDVLQLNQGTLYPALLRMEQEGWIASKWGASEKNRKARFYSITAAGRRRLTKETEDWRRMSSTIERFLVINPGT